MPQTFQDAVLGQLTYDDRLSRWDGSSPVLGVPFSLSAHTFGESEEGLVQEGEALELYRAAFQRLQNEEPVLRRQIAEAITGLAEEWREADENDQPLTPEDVRQRLTLESFSIYEDGDAELFYNDGELFAGHVVIAVVNEHGVLDKTSIAG